MDLEIQVFSLNSQCGHHTWDSTPAIPTAGWQHPAALPSLLLCSRASLNRRRPHFASAGGQARRARQKMPLREALKQSRMQVRLKLPQLPHLEVGLDLLSCILHCLPQVLIFEPQFPTAVTCSLRNPMLAPFLTCLPVLLVLSAITSQTGHSTCPWILVSWSSSAGAQPKTPLRYALSKGRNPLYSENEATKSDFPWKRGYFSNEECLSYLVYFLGHTLKLDILLNKV